MSNKRTTLLLVAGVYGLAGTVVSFPLVGMLASVAGLCAEVAPPPRLFEWWWAIAIGLSVLAPVAWHGLLPDRRAWRAAAGFLGTASAAGATLVVGYPLQRALEGLEVVSALHLQKEVAGLPMVAAFSALVGLVFLVPWTAVELLLRRGQPTSA